MSGSQRMREQTFVLSIKVVHTAETVGDVIFVAPGVFIVEDHDENN